MSNWQKEVCTQPPPLLDFESCPGHVIERKDISEEVVSGENGETRTEYSCYMRFLTTQEYTKTISEENAELRNLLADLTEVVLLGGM